jgi:hypothetical protein
MYLLQSMDLSVAFPKGHRIRTPDKADHAYENEAKLWGHQGKIDYLRRGIHRPMRATMRVRLGRRWTRVRVSHQLRISVCAYI